MSRLSDEQLHAAYWSAGTGVTKRFARLRAVADAAVQAYITENGDWSPDLSKIAGYVMNFFGYATDPSLEPGADWRRDKLSSLLAAHIKLPSQAAVQAEREGQEPVECGCRAGECESKPAATCRMTTEIRQNTAPPAAPVVFQQMPSGFAEWLRREMPAGTVIGDPDWWAPRIHRAMLAAACLADCEAPPAAPAIPQGWRLVPVELTDEMLDAARRCVDYGEGVMLDYINKVNRRRWKALLAAAPQPQLSGNSGEMNCCHKTVPVVNGKPMRCDGCPHDLPR